MPKTLTQQNDPAWDARPFSLTLAGCLHLAGMPLASEAVAETTPEQTADLRVIGDDQDALDASYREETDRLDILPKTEPFHVTDEKSANWYLKRLASIETEKARIKAQADKMLAELDADRDGLKFLYQSELEAFVKAELARKGGRKKTLHLLQGTCAFRTVGATVKLADPVAAFAHAKENIPAAIETLERLNPAEYSGIAEVFYKEFSKLLPGAEFVDRRESFSVKFGGKPDAHPSH